MRTWMDDNERLKGCSNKNIEYLRELKAILPEFSRIGTLTYFLVTRLGVEDARTMMNSAKKQKELILAVMTDLRKYFVTKDYEPVFERNLKSFRTRCDYVYAICKADLQLTEHWPYFEAVGFEKLLDFETRMAGKDESVLDVLVPEMEAWEAAHPDEIAVHMDAIRPELEARDRHKAEVREKEKAEKEAAKARKKAENDEIKEMKQNAKKAQQRQRKLEQEFETTMKHVRKMEIAENEKQAGVRKRAGN